MTRRQRRYGPRTPVGIIAAASIVTTALLAWSVGNRGRDSDSLSCKARSECAIRALLDAGTLGDLSPACREQALAAEARRATARGGGAVAVPVRLTPTSAEERDLPPDLLAETMASMTSLAGIPILPLLEPEGGLDCSSSEVAWFATAYRGVVRGNGGEPALTCRPAGGRTVLGSTTRDPVSLPSSVEVISGPELGDETFRFGWTRWTPGGRTQLQPGPSGQDIPCPPLVARLSPGGRVRQAVGGDAGEANLTIDVLPDDENRVIQVRTLEGWQEVGIRAGKRSANARVALPLPQHALELRNPDAQSRDLVVERVRIETAASAGIGDGAPASPPREAANRRQIEWGAATIPDLERVTRETIDLSKAPDRGPLLLAVDELNAWKAYFYFGVRNERQRQTHPPGWLSSTVPWATHVRIPAALGGNWCSQAPSPCSAPGRFDRTQVADCFDQPIQIPQRNEILREDNGASEVDFEGWNRGIESILESGVFPHLNISSAPCAFTDGYEYSSYRWNERPVIRSEEWRRFVRMVFEQASLRSDLSEWRFSIVNEPNCRWVSLERDDQGSGSHLVIHPIGYAGNSRQYAAQYVDAASEILATTPTAWLQLGNFTIGGAHSLEDNLPVYLADVSEEMRAAGVPVDRPRALSFSLYETPQHRLAELRQVKFGRLRRWVSGSDAFTAIPVKLDEVGIMDLVVKPFTERERQDLRETRWAAAWDAELIGLAAAEGVVSMAPWITNLFKDMEMTEPRPMFWTYALAAVAMGSVRSSPAGGEGVVDLVSVPPRDRVPRRLRGVRMAADDPGRIGYLALTDAVDASTWILLWNHRPSPVADRVLATESAVEVIIHPPGAPPSESSRGEVLAIDGSAEGVPWYFAPYKASVVRSRGLPVRGGRMSLSMEPESIVLVHLPGDRA